MNDTERLAKCSTRARKLYARLMDGRFYLVDVPNTPKAMKELMDAGLVAERGRVTRLNLCYVPKRGYRRFTMEKVGNESADERTAW